MWHFCVPEKVLVLMPEIPFDAASTAASLRAAQRKPLSILLRFHEFEQGSRITLTGLSNVQIKNLVRLANSLGLRLKSQIGGAGARPYLRGKFFVKSNSSDDATHDTAAAV